MNLFRLFLATCLIVVLGYTSVTVANHGMTLMSVFFGDMTKMAWPGQFDLDFMTLLLLSGLWVSWRHSFSPSGLALGVLAVFGGMMFLSIYLLIQSFSTRGDVKALLLGEARASQL